MKQTSIAVRDLRKLSFDTSEVFTRVQILKTYQAQIDCTSNDQFANLYICKRLANLDTIYVFDECSQAPDFAIDTSINIEVGIYPKDTLKNHSNRVTIFVPKGFRISKNAKYVFAKLKGIVL